MVENIRVVDWGIFFIIVKVNKLRTLEFFYGIKDYYICNFLMFFNFFYVFLYTSLFPRELGGFLGSRALPNVSL